MTTKDTKKVVEKEKDVVLLSEEEFERRRREKNKEQINRVLRIAGLFAVILIIYAGVLDPFFEMSFFGFIFDKQAYTGFWTNIWPTICARTEGALVTVFDDPLWFGDWLPKLAITLIIVTVVLGVVYLITYNIIDLVSAVKGLLNSSRDVVRDLRGTVSDAAEKEFGQQPKKVRKKLFSGDDAKKERKEEAKEKAKAKSRRADDLYDGLTEEQIDALLRGESLETVQARTDESEKKLFDE